MIVEFFAALLVSRVTTLDATQRMIALSPRADHRASTLRLRIVDVACETDAIDGACRSDAPKLKHRGVDIDEANRLIDTRRRGAAWRHVDQRHARGFFPKRELSPMQ